MLPNQYQEAKEKASQIFSKNLLVYCPYFNQEITLNSDGFHHLQFSDRRERNKDEQLLKFNLLPLALKVIRKSGTIQEYRKGLCSIGKKSARDGLAIMKAIQYWGLVAIVGDSNPQIKIRVILRQVGDGKLVLWSVMPAMKLSRDAIDMRHRLATKGIEDD